MKFIHEIRAQEIEWLECDNIEIIHQSAIFFAPIYYQVQILLFIIPNLKDTQEFYKKHVNAEINQCKDNDSANQIY